MDALERLAAIEEIKALKARYFRSIDTKDWDGFRAVFTDGAVMDMTEAQAGPDAGVITGADAMCAHVRSTMERFGSVHHGHMPEIDVIGPDEASGVWAMDDELFWTSRTGQARHMHGFGHYHDTYARVGGRWLISSTRLTRLRVETG